jgi:aspartate carbamoyltransferase regulatory subunit
VKTLGISDGIGNADTVTKLLNAVKCSLAYLSNRTEIAEPVISNYIRSRARKIRYRCKYCYKLEFEPIIKTEQLGHARIEV